MTPEPEISQEAMEAMQAASISRMAPTLESRARVRHRYLQDLAAREARAYAPTPQEAAEDEALAKQVRSWFECECKYLHLGAWGGW